MHIMCIFVLPNLFDFKENGETARYIDFSVTYVLLVSERERESEIANLYGCRFVGHAQNANYSCTTVRKTKYLRCRLCRAHKGKYVTVT